MDDSTWQLSKFDVAERQLLQAIRLFFGGGDEVSTHSLAEAAAQVLYDVIKFHGAGESIFRDSDRIRPERRKEWLNHISRSRNFFKHADKDPLATHAFKASFNHFSLLNAVYMYGQLKKAWTPETLMFYSWFVLRYPSMLKNDDTPLALSVRSNTTGPDPIDTDALHIWATCIDEARSGQRSLPGVTLAMGLQG